MDAGDVLTLTADRPRVEIAEGSRLLEAGDRQNAIYVLESGSLHVMIGGQNLSAIVVPGSVVGEISMLLDVPVTADVVAAEPTVVRVVDDAERLFREMPDFARFLAMTLARRVHRVSGFLSDLQAQFAEHPGTLGLVPDVIEGLLSDEREDPEPGSDREPDAPY